MIVFIVMCGLFAVTPSRGEAAEPLEPGCFACRCPRNLDYQCGSDGRSYQNQCMFQCAQEKCPDKARNVIITRRGRCDEL